MNGSATHRSVKSGLPPGTLIHIGEQSTHATAVRVISYSQESITEQQIGSSTEVPTMALPPSAVTWYDIEGLSDVEMIREIGERLHLHPLVLEDILNTSQRPKREEYDNYLFIVLKMLYPRDNGSIAAEQVSLVLGPNFVLSFQEGIRGDLFISIRDRIKSGKGRTRGMGADYLAYSLMDIIVDQYFTVLEEMGERIEALEEKVVAKPTPMTTREIHRLKRNAIFLRRAVWPLREVILSLERLESHLISAPVAIYLRDLYDHTVQAIDAIETSRDILSGTLDTYLSSINTRTNEIMRVLTVIATVFMPLSFLASLWGMNFKVMPELELRWGYPAALGIMTVVACVMLLWFRKRRWL